MEQDTTKPNHLSIGSRDVLTEILRKGAQDMLIKAIENEVQEYLEPCQSLLDGQGHRLVVRNGYLPERQIQTGVGAVSVRQPRINDTVRQGPVVGAFYGDDESMLSCFCYDKSPLGQKVGRITIITNIQNPSRGHLHHADIPQPRGGRSRCTSPHDDKSLL